MIVSQKFFKYSSCGNDFILIDALDGPSCSFNQLQREALCDRRFGIGADGILIISSSPQYDFRMTYYNSDGREVPMCGNGARAMAYHAYYTRNLKETSKPLKFETHSGVYSASEIEPNIVGVEMTEIGEFQPKLVEDFYSQFSRNFINTGVPHCVFFVENLSQIDIEKMATPIRHDPRFPQGTNVNFAEKIDDYSLSVRTFERGVEGETLSCGTGVMACALFFKEIFKVSSSQTLLVHTKGGEMRVIFREKLNPILAGPVKLAFTGEFDLSYY